MRGSHLYRQLKTAELSHPQLRHAGCERAEHDPKHDKYEPRRAERHRESDWDQGEHKQ